MDTTVNRGRACGLLKTMMLLMAIELKKRGIDITAENEAMQTARTKVH